MINEKEKEFISWFKSNYSRVPTISKVKGESSTIATIRLKYREASGIELRPSDISKYLRNGGFKVSGCYYATLWTNAVWKGGKVVQPLYSEQVDDKPPFRMMVKHWGGSVKPGLYASKEDLTQLKEIVANYNKQLGLNGTCWIERNI